MCIKFQLVLISITDRSSRLIHPPLPNKNTDFKTIKVSICRTFIPNLNILEQIKISTEHVFVELNVGQA